MMYTVEDFKKARFAEHRHGATATRNDRMEHWVLSDGFQPKSDEDMAREGWTPVREGAPASLDVLAAAYEAAEVPTLGTPIREGDTVISPHYGGRMFNVFEFEGGGRFSAQPSYRVLTRAPRREPWQDLADLLGHDVSAKQAEQMARRLHMVGVRVTGGEES